MIFFFFQAEDGIRDYKVTGVQTCALPILPSAWAEGLQRLIGVTPRSDREGCLQDIHWYDGAWGYFPTYTLGALIAAQLFAAARQALPDLAEQIGRGEFAPLFDWLRAHIHA